MELFPGDVINVFSFFPRELHISTLLVWIDLAFTLCLKYFNCQVVLSFSHKEVDSEI